MWNVFCLKDVLQLWFVDYAHINLSKPHSSFSVVTLSSTTCPLSFTGFLYSLIPVRRISYLFEHVIVVSHRECLSRMCEFPRFLNCLYWGLYLFWVVYIHWQISSLTLSFTELIHWSLNICICFQKPLKHHSLLTEAVGFVSVAFGPNWARRWKIYN